MGRRFTTFGLVASGGWLPRVFVLIRIRCTLCVSNTCGNRFGLCSWIVSGEGSTSQWRDGGGPFFIDFHRFLWLVSLRGATGQAQVVIGELCPGAPVR